MMRRTPIVLLALCTSGVAYAQTLAVEPERPSHPHPPAGLGANVVFGWAGQKDGPSGWSARLDYEVFPLFGKGKVSPVFGMQPGFEVWRSGEDNWGFSFPMALVAGARLFPFRIMAGGGIDAILVDQVDDDTGFGLYAPFAVAKLGLDVAGVQIGADARIGYRWQFGADDHTRWQFGIFAGYTATPSPRRRPVRNQIAK